jgi:hypothetical protein
MRECLKTFIMCSEGGRLPLRITKGSRSVVCCPSCFDVPFSMGRHLKVWRLSVFLETVSRRSRLAHTALFHNGDGPHSVKQCKQVS